MFMSKIFTKDIVNSPDIKYKGPLGYREIRIIAWVFFALSSLGMIFSLGSTLIPEATSFGPAKQVMDYVKDIPLPLFLIANFAVIFSNKTGYKRLLLTYGLLVILMFAILNFVYLHYIMGGVQNALHYDMGRAFAMTNNILAASDATSSSLNIFVDLFLCALIFFFLKYEPKKVFTGKKIKIFRSLVILPYLYVIACTIIKLYANKGYYVLPCVIYPLLTTKPILSFIAFTLIMLVDKIRTHALIKKGYNKEQIDTYYKSNRNKLVVSINFSIIFLIVGLIDLVLFLIAFHILNNSAVEDVFTLLNYLSVLGIGRTFIIILLIPLILLFNYAKEYDTKRETLINLLIPIGGLGLTAFTFFEGVFQVVSRASFWGNV